MTKTVKETITHLNTLTIAHFDEEIISIMDTDTNAIISVDSRELMPVRWQVFMVRDLIFGKDFVLTTAEMREG